MKNKNNRFLAINWRQNKEVLALSLFFILMGVFLLPKVAWLSSITEENIIKLTNNERSENNLGFLSVNELLTSAAYAKADDIMTTGIFQHNFGDRKFSAWIKEAGYKYSYAGENLAIDFITGEGALKAWLDSPTHKQNIFNEKFTETGVAVVSGRFKSEDTILVVQMFGAPLAIAATEGVAEKNISAPAATAYPDSPKNIVSAQVAGRDVAGTNKLSANLKLIYLNNADLFKIIVSSCLFMILLIMIDNLNRSRWANLFTPKNKQLRLPLR